MLQAHCGSLLLDPAVLAQVWDPACRHSTWEAYVMSAHVSTSTDGLIAHDLAPMVDMHASYQH